MHDPDFWNQYLSENSETLKNLVRESYPNKEFNHLMVLFCTAHRWKTFNSLNYWNI
jgi:hypothetical protein